jgi:hypothetical protein
LLISFTEPSQEDNIHVLRELLAHHAEQLKGLVKPGNPQIKAVIVRCCEEFLSETTSPLEFVKHMGSLFRHKDYAPDHKWIDDKLSHKKLQQIKLEAAFICRLEIAANTCFDAARDIPS